MAVLWTGRGLAWTDIFAHSLAATQADQYLASRTPYVASKLDCTHVREPNPNPNLNLNLNLQI